MCDLHQNLIHEKVKIIIPMMMILLFVSNNSPRIYFIDSQYDSSAINIWAHSTTRSVTFYFSTCSRSFFSLARKLPLLWEEEILRYQTFKRVPSNSWNGPDRRCVYLQSGKRLDAKYGLFFFFSTSAIRGRRRNGSSLSLDNFSYDSSHPLLCPQFSAGWFSFNRPR